MKSFLEIIANPLVRIITSGEDGLAFTYKHLFVIASSGDGWDHVSVSMRDKTPSWDDMCEIKDLCFYHNEYAMQLHPSKKDYVNCHPHCLHLWRPLFYHIPRPPRIMV